MPAGVRYPSKREASGHECDLWGFRFSLRYGAGAPVGGTRIGGSERGLQGRRAAQLPSRIWD